MHNFFKQTALLKIHNNRHINQNIFLNYIDFIYASYSTKILFHSILFVLQTEMHQILSFYFLQWNNIHKYL